MVYPVLNPSGLRCSDKCQDGLTLTFVCVDLLYPGERVDFHQGVRDADHVHSIHDTLS